MKDMKVEKVELRYAHRESNVLAVVDISIQEIFLIRGIKVVRMPKHNSPTRRRYNYGIVLPKGDHPDGFKYNIFDCSDWRMREYMRLFIVDAYSKKRHEKFYQEKSRA